MESAGQQKRDPQLLEQTKEPVLQVWVPLSQRAHNTLMAEQDSNKQEPKPTGWHLIRKNVMSIFQAQKFGCLSVPWRQPSIVLKANLTDGNLPLKWKGWQSMSPNLAWEKQFEKSPVSLWIPWRPEKGLFHSGRQPVAHHGLRGTSTVNVSKHLAACPWGSMTWYHLRHCHHQINASQIQKPKRL